MFQIEAFLENSRVAAENARALTIEGRQTNNVALLGIIAVVAIVAWRFL